jgi:hypothetical protein
VAKGKHALTKTLSVRLDEKMYSRFDAARMGLQPELGFIPTITDIIHMALHKFFKEREAKK